MFRRLLEGGERVMLRVDGRSVEARVGDSVAAALLAAGMVRTGLAPRLDSPRGPYCAIGVCFDCLVTVDGVGNRRACMVEVADGMTVDTQGPKRHLAR
jgi:predicted molibdopterin-dependent oxidoreductase YjgC